MESLPCPEQELKKKRSTDGRVAVSVLAWGMHLEFRKISLRSSEVKISYMLFKKFKDFLEKSSLLENPFP